MLSRTAAQLYWMSRYMERAENMARILNVIHKISLLPQAPGYRLDWRALLSITGTLSDYQQKFGEISEDNILFFLTLDQENPASIYNSLRLARENAHAVRGRITSEMWESINATWLDMKEHNLTSMQLMGTSAFFEWIKERSHLFRGVTYGTILRDDTYRFLRLGTFIERADSTARILDVQYHILMSQDRLANAALEYYQWGALLRSVSAFVAYRTIYRDQLKPESVAELLILRADMPRSLHACLDEIQQLLHQIEGDAGRRAQWLAEELHASLHYASINDIFEHGLHEFLVQFLNRIHELGNRIQQAYLVA